MYFFFDSECNNESIKVQDKQAFLSPSKTIRKTGSASNFLQPSIQVCRCFNIPYFKMKMLIFCCFIFFEECLNPQVRIDKMVNKYVVDYHPSPSEFTSMIQPLIILWTPKGFISEHFLNFFSNLYIPSWLQKCFQIHGFKIAGKYICESKS